MHNIYVQGIRPVAQGTGVTGNEQHITRARNKPQIILLQSLHLYYIYHISELAPRFCVNCPIICCIQLQAS